MRPRPGWIWLVFCILLSGCAAPQYAEHYSYEKEGVVVASAWRYAGNVENPVHRLWIDLGRVPAFDIRMPDGSWVNSQNVTLSMLAHHGFAVSRISERNVATWHPSFTVGALVGRHQYMSFEADARELSLGACGWSFHEVLRAPDGQRAFGFPIALKELDELLGPPSRVDRVSLLTGLSCF